MSVVASKGDELTLVELICDREEEDLQLLMSEYQKQHDISLVNAIRKKYSGRKLENCERLPYFSLQGPRLTPFTSAPLCPYSPTPA